MKPYILTLAVLLVCIDLQGQTPSIDQILKSIEENNKELQANRQLVESQKLEAATDNNLPDPEVSYAYMWGKHDASISELAVTQSFDFPTLYAGRHQLNKLKRSALDKQADIVRRDILAQAREACLDIIWLKKQKKILDERLDNANELSAMYAKRLQTGDANILETNKINLELLNVRTETTLNESALENKLKELAALNGNKPVDFTLDEYPAVVIPADYEQLKIEVVSHDRELQAMLHENVVVTKETSIIKSQWLPRLEVGYRRNTESGTPFNGVVVGFSIPLFENRNKAKAAKAKAFNLTYQIGNRVVQVDAELSQLYNEAKTLYRNMQEYEKTFAAQSDLSLLKQALTGGQISMIEYFVEVSGVYQSKLNYLQLQNQYQKVMGRVYRNRL